MKKIMIALMSLMVGSKILTGTYGYGGGVFAMPFSDAAMKRIAKQREEETRRYYQNLSDQMKKQKNSAGDTFANAQVNKAYDMLVYPNYMESCPWTVGYNIGGHFFDNGLLTKNNINSLSNKGKTLLDYASLFRCDGMSEMASSDIRSKIVNALRDRGAKTAAELLVDNTSQQRVQDAVTEAIIEQAIEDVVQEQTQQNEENRDQEDAEEQAEDIPAME